MTAPPPQDRHAPAAPPPQDRRAPGSPTPPPPGRPVPPPGCPAHAGEPAALYGEEFARDAPGTYRRLRAFGPFAPVRLAPGVDAILVTGYDAALKVLRGTDAFGKDARRWRALQEGRVPPDSPVVPMMTYRANALYAEGSEHRRLRGAIDDSLARIDAGRLREDIQQSSDALIDRFAGRGTADLMADYCRDVPLRVLIRLFGCTPELGDRLYRGIRGIFDGVDAERASALMDEALTELIELRRRRPSDDMVSRLLEHESRLTDAELVDQLVVLTGASTEPQQNLIANALRLLLSDDRFAGTLNGGSLPVEDALDEVLWTDPPLANYGIHYPFHDVEIDGTLLPAGTPVMVSFAAATTEPSLVTDQRAGNRAHLAWSAGPHGCPAQREARIIATVAIERLLDRVPDLELAVPVEELRWRPGPFHRALVALPVRFPPVAPLLPAAAEPAGMPAVMPAGIPAPGPAPEPAAEDAGWSAGPRPASAPATATPPAAASRTSRARGSGSRRAPRRRRWSLPARWWPGR